MLPPINCPVCNDSLVNEYIRLGRMPYLKKLCAKRINHKFQCFVPDSEEHMSSFTTSLSYNPMVQAVWDFDSNQILVHNGTIEEIVTYDREPTIIPWFDPDLTDFRSSLKKLKTYLIFS
jgi:hypothetical protein